MSLLETLRSKSSRNRRVGIWLLSSLLALAIAGGLALSARTNDRHEPREITLTARGMAFYLAGDPTPNPTLVVRRGEAVRLTLVNQDLGMTHDFAVESLDVATRALRQVGTTTSLVFEAPGRPGRSEYVCTFHVQMMKGVLLVQ
jgi:heme/copper-type cytochrome/quinol oxidase subunit 2